MAVQRTFSKADFQGSRLPRRICAACHGTGQVHHTDYEPYGDTVVPRTSEAFCECPKGRDAEAYEVESYGAKEGSL